MEQKLKIKSDLHIKLDFIASNHLVRTAMPTAPSAVAAAPQSTTAMPSTNTAVERPLRIGFPPFSFFCMRTELLPVEQHGTRPILSLFYTVTHLLSRFSRPKSGDRREPVQNLQIVNTPSAHL